MDIRCPECQKLLLQDFKGSFIHTNVFCGRCKKTVRVEIMLKVLTEPPPS